MAKSGMGRAPKSDYKGAKAGVGIRGGGGGDASYGKRDPRDGHGTPVLASGGHAIDHSVGYRYQGKDKMANAEAGITNTPKPASDHLDVLHHHCC